jgi:integrase
VGRRRKHDRHLPERVYLKHGSYYYASPVTGKWERLGKTLADMYRAYAKFVEPPVRVTTMGHVFDRYLQEALPALATRTQRDYVGYIVKLRLVFGSAPPRSVTPAHIVAYQSARKSKSHVQANREIACLSAVFRCALEWQLVDSNPCHQVARLLELPRERYVEDWELELVYRGANEKLRAAIDLTRLTGLREGDLLTLGAENITEEGIEIVLGKSRRKVTRRGKLVERTRRIIVTWTPELRQIVENLQQMSPRQRLTLLCTQEGTPYTSSGFDSLWRRAMDRALAIKGPDGQALLKESFTFHDLRAKNASDEEDVAVASNRLGHMDAKTTKRVYRRKPTRVRPLQ